MKMSSKENKQQLHGLKFIKQEDWVARLQIAPILINHVDNGVELLEQEEKSGRDVRRGGGEGLS